MPYKEREINKLYYTMGEVTSMFAVNASQIRFYEREFDIIQPKKNKKGNRLFTQEDISNLKIIFNLVKNKGYTLQGAREFLRQNKNEARENQRVVESLEKLKSFLLEVRDSL
ncbi:MerR family transcriptional regulator [Sphingobacterium sp. lm-10]|uniref:MerR family transcriptional regulator n=1 Tax=Sphingobacterium sp. lm-10 TaxID=2944904 RepID=UPI00202074AF|nr:MerR family transcriptional regulator [Sphingobacterium sp. lm-10]MCL7989023.1 MerR family transcriptional regulator [Sphingobacterium sp. lm-10]